MTLDEAINHCEEMAERYERMEDSHDDKLREECLQCAADHRQLAEWLTELKELISLKTDYVFFKAEAKKLSKVAVEDMYNSINDVHCKYCSKWHTGQCQGTSHLDCYVENKFKWRYADEALALIGEEGDAK